MGEWIVDEIINEMKNIEQSKCKFLILGVTFKENCPDTRNSKVQDIVKFLNRKNIIPSIYDPYIENSESLDASLEFDLINRFEKISQNYDVVIVAVAHQQFKSFTYEDWSNITKDGIIYDVKSLVPKNETYAALNLLILRDQIVLVRIHQNVFFHYRKYLINKLLTLGFEVIVIAPIDETSKFIAKVFLYSLAC